VAHSTVDVNITKIEPLLSPEDLIRRLPLTAKTAETVLSGREQVQNILRGEDHRMLVIVGPCSIHDEAAAIDYAERLVKLAGDVRELMLIVMRVYFEKPRTTIGWKGLINDPHLDGSLDIAAGLDRARSLLLRFSEMGILAATEFLDPIVPQYLADLVSWAAIGARTTESQTHRQMASGLSMPVGFKNGTDGNSQIAMDAMKTALSPHAFLGMDSRGQTSVVHTTGNTYGHLVLRGGTSGANYEAKAVAELQQQLRDAGLSPRLLVDCSHANSDKDHTRQSIALRAVVEQRMAGNDEIAGVMVESNINAGNQKLGEDPSTLAYGVSITDACISWDETSDLLTEAHSRLAIGQPVR
jgi:3-deoxy-7-phosphoheptulonate synthase